MPHKNIEQEHLPYRESMTKGRDRGGYWRYSRNSDYHPVEGIYPYKNVRRVLDKFIGKPVNEAFTKFCKMVPVYQQKYFWKEITASNYRRRNINYWYVDDEGLIQETYIYEPTLVYRVNSWNAKWGYIDIRTGEPLSYFAPHYYTKWGLIKGTIYEFSSKDYKYWRRFYEEASKKRAYDRLVAECDKQIKLNLTFITKKDIEKKKESAEKHRNRIYYAEMRKPSNKYSMQMAAYMATLKTEESEA